MTKSCAIIEPPTAMLNILFEKSPTEKMDFLADRQANALNMSKKTNVVKVMVASLFVTTPSSSSDT